MYVSRHDLLRSHAMYEEIKIKKKNTPSRKPGFRKELKDGRKAVASRYYQLLTGHVLIVQAQGNRLGTMLVVRDR